MIPTMILFGLAFGRWWRSTLIAAALLWPALLLGTHAMQIEVGLLGASGLAVANAGGGVLVHQVILRTARGMRRARSARVGSSR
ncbi:MULTISPECIES: hypothetical protein [unclassified Micromonospora]|uniref:hypothetical protein n=1 Tax=unclassified Micromonospora TaxID=2617518 RepID=UPI002E1B6B3F